MKRAVRRINFPGLTSTYAGKVRDMYFLGNKCAVAVTTDQISAFDVVLPRTIPGKGQVLTEIARHFLLGVKDIVPIWYISSPLPQVMIGDPEYYGRFWGFSNAQTGQWRLPGPFEQRRLLVRCDNSAVLPVSGTLGPWPL